MAVANAFAEPHALTPDHRPHPGDKLAEIILPRVLHIASVIDKRPFYVTFATPEAALIEPLVAQGVRGFDVGRAAVAATLFPGKADALAGMPADKRFDVFVLAEGASGQEIAALVTRGLARPGCIYLANAAALAGASELAETLGASNYIQLAKFQGAEIYLDGAAVAKPTKRPALATFDVFDTLIARRCGDPHKIFEMVEAASEVADFAVLRKHAEARVSGGDYTLDDIYAEFSRLSGLGAADCGKLKDLELGFELDNAIPIAENLRLVADGDLLISDMYLGEADIRALLAKAGLTKHVGLYVSSRGKHSGAAWRQLTGTFDVTLHVGDNATADVEMPKRFGVPTRHTRATDFNVVEGTLDTIGLGALARLCREARLACWHDDPGVRAAQSLQTSVNFPLLLLASAVLARKATALGSKTLLFCGRDCNLWLPLFAALQQRLGTAFDTKYFLTSRVARKNGSDAYLAYARKNIGAESLVIDLCGTGWSTAILAERLGLTGCNIFLLHHLAPFAIYEQWKPTPASCVVHSLFDVRPAVHEARMLELANMAGHGMLVDMRQIGAATLPVLAETQLSETQTVFVAAQRAAFDTAVRLLPAHDIDDILGLDDGSLQAVCASLLEFLSKQTRCYEMFWPSFVAEDKAIMRALMG